MTNIEKFLNSGSIFLSGPKKTEEAWVGWGPAVRSAHLKVKEESDSGSLAFYAPDFFLKDFNPWWIYPSGSFGKFSRESLIETLQDWISNCGEDVTLSEDSGFFKNADQEFSKRFQGLQTLFANGELKKAVPISMKKYHASGNLSLLRAQWLLNLLKNTRGFPLWIYGTWNENEGVLGASPELLFETVKESNGKVRTRTAALAGTRLKSEREGRLPLLEDPKELAEHQWVIDGISTSLHRMGLSPIEIGKTQELELPTLSHLYTEVSAQGQAGFEETAQRLHPTPALGAFPKERGWEWLKAQEVDQKRLRFGAPFGVLTPTSECETIVAIRNVQWVTQEVECKVFLTAGCGVIAESQCSREWSEILGKMASIQKLLGIEL